MDVRKAQNEVLKHMVELRRPEPMANVMEILNHQIDYQEGFDLANEMQNKDFIKIIYCVFPNVINVQLTLIGKKEHENTSRLSLPSAKGIQAKRDGLSIPLELNSPRK